MIADDVAGPDTHNVDRPNDPDHRHAGAVVDGQYENVWCIVHADLMLLHPQDADYSTAAIWGWL